MNAKSMNGVAGLFLFLYELFITKHFNCIWFVSFCHPKGPSGGEQH